MKIYHYLVLCWTVLNLGIVFQLSNRQVSEEGIVAFCYFMSLIVYLWVRGEPYGR
jgi:hypothetical protein